MVATPARIRSSTPCDGGVTYEEYHPYGTTAWWAEKSGIQVSQKRYRYTGMERDEETGLGYHSARYYAPWLGRWERPDPAGLVDGPNRFAYARGNPAKEMDTSGLSTFGLYQDAGVIDTPQQSAQQAPPDGEVPSSLGRFEPEVVDLMKKAFALSYEGSCIGKVRNVISAPLHLKTSKDVPGLDAFDRIDSALAPYPLGSPSAKTSGGERDRDTVALLVERLNNFDRPRSGSLILREFAISPVDADGRTIGRSDEISHDSPPAGFEVNPSTMLLGATDDDGVYIFVTSIIDGTHSAVVFVDKTVADSPRFTFVDQQWGGGRGAEEVDAETFDEFMRTEVGNIAGYVPEGKVFPPVLTFSQLRNPELGRTD